MPRSQHDFVHLHVHSEYSLLDGCARIPALVSRALEHGYDSLAVTDHGAAYGLVPFYRRAVAAGLKPILGAELYVRGSEGQAFHLPVLAETTEGYGNLLRLVSLAHLDGFHAKPMVTHDQLASHHEGLIAFSGCLKGEAPQMLMRGQAAGARAVIERYRDIFGAGNLFLEIQRHGLTEEDRVNAALIAWAPRLGLRTVATHDVHYLEPEDWRMHDVLLAVQTLSTVTQANRLRLSTPRYYLAGPDEMERLFADVPDAIRATADIAGRCRAGLDLKTLHIPQFPAPGGDTPQYLTNLCLEAAHRKYPAGIPREVTDRLGYELKIINEMGFAGYFLIVWDIVSYAKREGIPVGPGRGSAVGSIVSYLLDISTVNPLDYGLLFERFLNPERVSMPDIDIDLCHVGRPRVLDYIRNRWGREHVAHLGAFTTMRPRAAVRDVGRALGVNQNLIDRLARAIPAYSGDLEQVLVESPHLRRIVDEEPEAREITDLARQIQGLPRHMTQHAAGVVLADGPLTHYVALQRAGGDEIITQADMHAVEDLGLLKIDLLGLRYLTVIDETCRAIARERRTPFRVEDIPLEDTAIYEDASRGLTIGTFQLESAGMRRLLRRLRPESLEDIMSVCALFRPGPLGSGMVEAFIRRRHGEEAVTFFHPNLEPVLRETYGVILYQEQVMQVARVLAGYSLGRADMLRKAIAKRDPAGLEKERVAFVQGAQERGVPGGVAEKVFDLIREFGGYGFAKAHAAAYAQTAARTVWLRHCYPVPYFAAMLSLNYGEQERFDQYLSEVRYLGIPLLPPDINRSSTLFTPEGRFIRAGLGLICDVGDRAARAIMAERARGEFASLGDFCRRLGGTLSRKVVANLVRAGAFDSFGGTRPGMLLAFEGLWQAGREEAGRVRTSPGQLQLPGAGVVSQDLGYCPPEFSKSERQEMERDLLGFYLTSHPLEPFVTTLERLGVMEVAGVSDCDHGESVFLGGCLGGMRGHRTRDGKRMMFAFIEDMSGRADLVIFPTVLQKHGPLISERRPLLVWGQVDRTEEEPTVVVRRVQEMKEELRRG